MYTLLFCNTIRYNIRNNNHKAKFCMFSLFPLKYKELNELIEAHEIPGMTRGALVHKTFHFLPFFFIWPDTRNSINIPCETLAN